MASEAPTDIPRRPQIRTDPSLSGPERQNKVVQKLHGYSVTSVFSTSTCHHVCFWILKILDFSLDCLLAASTGSVLRGVHRQVSEALNPQAARDPQRWGLTPSSEEGEASSERCCCGRHLHFLRTAVGRPSSSVWGQFAPREVPLGLRF